MNQKKEAPSNQDASVSQTPRARYNSKFAARIQKVLAREPEVNLYKEISKYDTRHWKRLTDAPAMVQPGAKAGQEARDTFKYPTQPPVPEPNGDFRIISPLAPQMRTLVGLETTGHSNVRADLPAVLWPLLQNGEVLHQLFPTWLIKISPTIVVKISADLDTSEIQTMSYIWEQRGIIPIPEPLGSIVIGTCCYMFMSYIDGVSLAELWPTLPSDLKTSVQSQLGEILQCLRKLPLQSTYLGSGSPPYCRDLRRHVRVSPGSISNEKEFNAFLTSTQRELNPLCRELLTSKLRTGHDIVMTHGDIRPKHILVQYTAPGSIKITGLIDWAVSGAYPEYWEYVKALNEVDCDFSDWHSYLPTDVIGNHSDAWRQDTLISRMVL